jgi:hypothetical protein
VPSSVQKCKSACGLCKGANVRCWRLAVGGWEHIRGEAVDTGGGLQLRVAGGGVGSGPRHDLVASGRVERPAQPRLTRAGQPYPGFALRRTADAMAIASLPKAEARNQRETGNREGCCGHEIILGSQVSAFGCLVQVFRFGYRFGRCLAQPLTANRFHLIWVGSALRADLVASGRVERPAQPRLTKGGQPYRSALRRTADAMSSRPYPRQVHEFKGRP